MRLNRIGTGLSALEYPATPGSVAAACADVVVTLAEGEVALAGTIERSHADRFDGADDVELEFLSLLPRHAVGEPFQPKWDA